MLKFNDTRTVLHIIILVLAVLTACLTFYIADIIIVTNGTQDLYAHHFICAIIYSNVALSTCVFVVFLLGEEFPQKMLMIFNITAAITYAIVGGLYFARYYGIRSCYNRGKETALNMEYCNGILCFTLAILHFSEFMMNTFKK